MIPTPYLKTGVTGKVSYLSSIVRDRAYQDLDYPVHPVTTFAGTKMFCLFFPPDRGMLRRSRCVLIFL